MSLREILRQARRDSVEFPHLLANHAPMALVALAKLGASDARLIDWYAAYRADKRLVAPPPLGVAIAEPAWRDALGEREREADYRAFFTREVRRLSPRGACRRYLPDLIPGVGASALHPLMRLAYADIAEDDEETGAALGYWAACHLPLLPSASAEGSSLDDPAAVLAAVADIEGVRTCRAETGLLWHNIRAVAALPGFCAVAGRLAFRPETPRRMTATALALYAGTMDFSALHAVTSLHWARVVAEALDEPGPLYLAVWRVIAALVPKIGFPVLPDDTARARMRAARAPDWPEIRAAAVASADEHDISLAYSAWAEAQFSGDRLYQVVAARRLGLIDPL